MKNHHFFIRWKYKLLTIFTLINLLGISINSYAEEPDYQTVITSTENGKMFVIRPPMGSIKFFKMGANIIMPSKEENTVVLTGAAWAELTDKNGLTTTIAADNLTITRAIIPKDKLTIQQQLEQAFDEDQHYRKGVNFDETKMGEADKKNLELLEEIVTKIGFPTRDLVGVKASDAAFLIVQHASYEIQKKYYPFIKKAVATGQFSAQFLAMLEDRIATNENRPQVYGTQFQQGPDGKYIPLPIDDPEHVEERRAKVGLSPLNDELKAIEENEATKNAVIKANSTQQSVDKKTTE